MKKSVINLTQSGQECWKTRGKTRRRSFKSHRNSN